MTTKRKSNTRIAVPHPFKIIRDHRDLIPSLSTQGAVSSTIQFILDRFPTEVCGISLRVTPKMGLGIPEEDTYVLPLGVNFDKDTEQKISSNLHSNNPSTDIKDGIIMKNYRIQDQNATGEQSLFRGYLRVAFTENAVDSRCFKGIAENLEHKLTNSLHIHNKLINEKFFFIRNMEIINIITRNFDEWQQGKRMDMALVYTDIRSSTKTQASLGQDLYFHFIKKIQNMQIETVLKNMGYFDKFTGDGMLAAFGMFDQKDLVLNAHRALTCVADLLSALKDLNQTKLEHAQNLEEFKAENELMNKLRETKFAMGVGVHCGSGRMALIGQEKKHMELTVFGDVANVGQRYEAATKLESVNYPFVISEATCDLLYTRKDISLDAELCNAFEEPGKTSVLKEQAMHGPLKCFKVKSFIDTNQQKRDILGLLDYIWPVQVAD